MNNHTIISSLKKEKEATLSLLRIPIIFFSEKTNSPSSKETNNDKTTNKKNEPSPQKDSNDTDSITFHASNTSSQKTPTSGPTRPQPNNTQNTPTPPPQKTSEQPNSPAKKGEAPKTPSPKSDSQPTKKGEDPKATSPKSATPPLKDSKKSEPDKKMPQPPSEDEKQKDKTPPPPKPAPQPSKDDKESNSDKDDSTNTSESAGDDNESSSIPDDSDNSSDDSKLDEYTRRFAKRPSSSPAHTKPAKPASEHHSAKGTGKKHNSDNSHSNKHNNGTSSHMKKPSGIDSTSKVGQAAENAGNIKDTLQNLDSENAKEAMGDVAVKAASKIPGAWGKAIGAADKLVGKTQTGKTVKKAIGCCCSFGCISAVAFMLIPIIVVVSAFSWITNLFSRDKKYVNGYEKLSEKERGLLEEASRKYSMQEYTDLTMELDNPTFWDEILDWFSSGDIISDQPIQDATLEYINKNYEFSKEDAEEYNDTYASLINGNYLRKIKAGDLTSFGLAFESLKSHYSIKNLKAPSSAPKGKKTSADGSKEIIYTTYDPKGTHQALFEDVLNNMPDLISRFKGQVNPNWFENGEEDNKSFKKWLFDYDIWLQNPNYTLQELDCWDKVSIKTILDTKCKVQVYDYDENSIEDLSLRELFKETSTVYYDTQYHLPLVTSILSNTNNSKINVLYKQLKKKLATLELMTYMLAYRSYYNTTNKFLEGIRSYDNYKMFNDPNFWARYLTFSNVEHFIALSSSADHSLAYEIAVCSASAMSSNREQNEGIRYKTFKIGGKNFVGITQLSNWYATYSFDPQITISPTSDSTYFYSGGATNLQETEHQKYLFEKYNVGEGKKQSSFFALFEAATGIKFSDYDLQGNSRTPTYKLTKDGDVKEITFPLTESGGLGRVTKGYMELYSDETVTAYNMNHKVHYGIDYGIPSGTDVSATASGTAYITRSNSGYGNYVKIIHDDGYTSIYAHGNGTFYINNGDRVSAGQLIMQSGNSGNSTGPHLHFEVRDPSGKKINPTSYIYGTA